MNGADGSEMGADKVDTDPLVATAGAPLVIIQYRERGVALSLVIPVVMTAAFVSIALYHRTVGIRYLERQSSQSAVAVKAASVEPEVPAAEHALPEPLASNSQPIAAGSDDPVLVSAVTVPSPAKVEPAPTTPAAGALSPSVAMASSAEKGAFGPVAPDAGAPAVANLPADTPKPAGAASEPPKPAMIATASGLVDPTPIASPGPKPDPLDPNKMGEVADTRSPAMPDEDRPLPTKEETEREIIEEARAKRAELETLAARQAASARDLKRSGRREFRDELKEILTTFGNRAGPEIDSLARRTPSDVSGDQFLRARDIWRFSRNSTAMKVKAIRALGLPEVTILNFLSDTNFAQIGTRDGPRNANEIRIRAAKALLSYELSPSDDQGAPGAENPVTVERAPSQPKFRSGHTRPIDVSRRGR
jgi:hypothetical protein